MKLSVGCGEVRHDGFVHVDIRADCGADVVCDACALPFGSESCSHVCAEDILEHLLDPQDALAEWHRVLRPGGLLELRVPNLHALCVQLAYYADKPGPALDALIANIYGAHLWGPDGCFDTHHVGFTPSTLAVTLDAAGFDVISNSLELNMRVEARKRDDSRAVDSPHQGAPSGQPA